MAKSHRSINHNVEGDPLSACLFLMTIEFFGKLTSAIRRTWYLNHGTTVATRVYFADHSTLLSETPNGVMTQLELVQVYCDGSVVKLNLSEFILALGELDHAVSIYS